jgi:hypothetical protein
LYSSVAVGAAGGACVTRSSATHVSSHDVSMASVRVVRGTAGAASGAAAGGVSDGCGGGGEGEDTGDGSCSGEEEEEGAGVSSAKDDAVDENRAGASRLAVESRRDGRPASGATSNGAAAAAEATEDAAGHRRRPWRVVRPAQAQVALGASAGPPAGCAMRCAERRSIASRGRGVVGK